MNKLYKLFITATAIASVLGWNINVAQAQSQETYCTASAIGALLGLAITGDAETAASVIPSECTENNQPAPKRPYRHQQPSRRDSNDYVNQQRLWLLEQQRVEREREDREYQRVSGCMDNCLASTDPNCMSRCS
jgi:hypothetical protein